MLNTRWISTISGVKDNRIKHSYVSFAKRKPKIGKMIEIYSEFLKFISDYLIKGIFISILVIILIKLIAKSKIKTVKSTEIIKWIIVIYSFGVLVHTILIFTFPPTGKNDFLERATGPYWWAYWLMLSMNSIIPLILLNRKIGRKIYFLLIISLLMNIGWLFESFVVHSTSLSRDFIGEEYNPYLPSKREFTIILKGFLFGIILVVVENIIKKRQKIEYEKIEIE